MEKMQLQNCCKIAKLFFFVKSTFSNYNKKCITGNNLLNDDKYSIHQKFLIDKTFYDIFYMRKLDLHSFFTCEMSKRICKSTFLVTIFQYRSFFTGIWIAILFTLYIRAESCIDTFPHPRMKSINSNVHIVSFAQ